MFMLKAKYPADEQRGVRKINVSCVIHIWLWMGLLHDSAQGVTISNSLCWSPLFGKAHSHSACQLWYGVAFRWNFVGNKINKWSVKVRSTPLTRRPTLQWHDKYYICLALSTAFTRAWIRLHKVTWILHAVTCAHSHLLSFTQTVTS